MQRPCSPYHADIAKGQEWLGLANMATIRLYDRRQSRPEESPSEASSGAVVWRRLGGGVAKEDAARSGLPSNNK
jgi:hypothetical protein